MKLLFTILAVLSVLNATGQCDDLVNGKLKAQYICYTSSPNDTSFCFLYYYNQDNSLDRIENYHGDKLYDITQFIYSKKDSIVRRLKIIPQVFDQICGDMPKEKCWPQFEDKVFSYDSVNNKYYMIFGDDTLKSRYDTIYQDSKIAMVLYNKDTLFTYLYDKQNQLVKRDNYGQCTKGIISWTEFQYKENLVVEYDYIPERKKKPAKITENRYNDDGQLIEKTQTFISSGRKQPVNNFITEKYTYRNGKLRIYEKYDNYIDPCFNMYCCGRYKKYYVYYE